MLEISHVSKFYRNVAALRDISLSVREGEIIGLLGPSGCGKSTLLRVVAGLEHAETGSLCFDGQQIDTVPTHGRGFGLMFQDYALFPHMNVARNIAFGLHGHEMGRDMVRRRVDELLDLVGLKGYGPRRVDQLSGGERQRVALARSLAPNPRLLMLDEPLGALDRALRERLLDELHAILKRVGVTSLYVTHDQAEAFAIADRLVLMNAGQIEQEGTPEQVYRHPVSRFAAQFMGLRNLIAGAVVDVTEERALVETPLGRFALASAGAVAGSHVTVVLRPEAAELESAAASGLNIIHGVLLERSFRGGRTRLTVQPASVAPLEFELDAGAAPQVGEPITLALQPSGISLLPAA